MKTFLSFIRTLALVASSALILPSIGTAQIFTIVEPTGDNNAVMSSWIEIPDITGDGIVDYAVPSGSWNVNRGILHIFSGADLSLVRSLRAPVQNVDERFGEVIAVAQDLAGTTAPELYVSAFGETTQSLSFAGSFYVFDAASSSALTQVFSPNPTAFGAFGYVDTIEDLNSDGRRDLVVGASGEGLSGGGRFYVLSGMDYSVMATVNSPNAEPDGGFGIPVVVPDLNADSVDDIAVSAQNETVSGLVFAGRVYVYSGATRALLYTLTGSPPLAGGGFGRSVISVPDSNGDGVADLLVSSRDTTSSGRCDFFSGATGTLLQSIYPPNQSIQKLFGSAHLGSDIDGDSVRDIFIGEDIGNAVFAFSGATRGPLGSLIQASNVDGAIPSMVRDLDGDGQRDLALLDQIDNRIRFYSTKARLTVSPSQLNFDYHSVTSPVPAVRTLTLRNSGFSPLNVVAPFAAISGANATEFGIGQLPTTTTLGAGANVPMTVTFQPAVQSPREALLTISSDVPGEPITTVTLRGTGAIPPAPNFAYITGGLNIYAVNLTTGDRTILTGPNNGTGPAITSDFTGLVIENSTTLLASAGMSTFYRIDRATGNRTTFSPTYLAPAQSVRGMAMENSTQVILGEFNSGCARLDLVTGQVTPLSNNFGIGFGDSFGGIKDVCVEANGTIAVGADVGNKIVRVNPNNGNRTTVLGMSGQNVWNIAATSDGDFIVVSTTDKVYRTNGVSGVTTILSDANTGNGPLMSKPRGVDVAANGGIYVFDTGTRTLYRIDSATGNRTVISSDVVGSGPALDVPIVYEDRTFIAVDSTQSFTNAQDWALYE